MELGLREVPHDVRAVGVVASVDSQVGAEAIGFGGGNNKRIAARLAESGLDGLDPLIAATVVTAVVHRVNLFQHTGEAMTWTARC